MAGTSGSESLQGAAGNDIYVGSAGNNDSYFDAAISNDLYGGFVSPFDFELITDWGGVDKVDLSTSPSANFTFHKVDRDGDGVEDDLNISDETNGIDDIYVIDHFGAGRIEYIKFSDTTLKGADLPLS